MTAHQSTGVVVIGRHTQDGYDWPTPHPQCPSLVPMTPYWRAQLLDDDSYLADVPIWREEQR